MTEPVVITAAVRSSAAPHVLIDGQNAGWTRSRALLAVSLLLLVAISAFIVAADRMFPDHLTGGQRFIALLAVLAFPPLHILVLIGMEHSLHCGEDVVREMEIQRSVSTSQ